MSTPEELFGRGQLSDTWRLQEALCPPALWEEGKRRLLAWADASPGPGWGLSGISSPQICSSTSAP